VLLRPRQREFVERCVSALDEHGNTVGIAATGFGKTIALSAIVGRHLKEHGSKVLVLQHRDELLNQNRAKMAKVVPGVRASIFNAEHKSWAGDVVFASEPTLRRQANVERMPEFGLAVIDEVHHVAAQGYQSIIARLRENNPLTRLFGTTATIRRGDKATLKPTFTNVADVVGIRELVATGHLVRPRVFVVDVGVQQELRGVRKIAGEYDQDRVAEIFNQPVVNEAVIKHWLEKASERPTIAFCSSVQHASDMAREFRDAGIPAEVVHGELSIEERRRRLRSFELGHTRVLTNVAVLTEGYDFPPVSCVIYLKMSSYKSTFIQAVGRALRTIDADLYPGVIKTDAMVLDFGNTAKMIGELTLDKGLADEHEPGDTPSKECPKCGMLSPLGTQVCDHCGHVFEDDDLDGDGLEEEEDRIANFIMSEIDLLKKSSFMWVDLFGDENSLMATGFSAWAGCFTWGGEVWYAIGGVGAQGVKREVKYLGAGTRIVALAMADDWMSDHETSDSANKSKSWLKLDATEKQLSMLGLPPNPIMGGMSRYHASCRLAFQFNLNRIKHIILSRQPALAA
jgi:DNA repair protein RadD